MRSIIDLIGLGSRRAGRETRDAIWEYCDKQQKPSTADRVWSGALRGRATGAGLRRDISRWGSDEVSKVRN